MKRRKFLFISRSKTDVAQTMLQRLEDEKVFNQKVSDKVKKLKGV